MKKKAFPKNIEIKNGRIFEQRDFYDLSEVLDSLSSKLKLDDKKKDFSIMLFWQDFAKKNTSELIAKNTKAHRFNKDRKLVIAVKSAVIANELQFAKALLEDQFLKEVREFDREVKGLIFELR